MLAAHAGSQIDDVATKFGWHLVLVGSPTSVNERAKVKLQMPIVAFILEANLNVILPVLCAVDGDRVLGAAIRPKTFAMLPARSYWHHYDRYH